MAVPKKKKSRSKRNKRRSQDLIKIKSLSKDNIKQLHIRHHISLNGYYYKKENFNNKNKIIFIL